MSNSIRSRALAVALLGGAVLLSSPTLAGDVAGNADAGGRVDAYDGPPVEYVGPPPVAGYVAPPVGYYGPPSVGYAEPPLVEDYALAPDAGIAVGLDY